MRALAILALLAAPAMAAPAPPCKGCTLEVPTTIPAAGAPLLVVLHGDRQQAAAAAQRWRAAAKQRGWILLSLQCPVAEGCKDSWWQWNGDPAWITAQLDRVARDVKVDRARIGLVGWSGGASYMGANANRLRYAGLVFHGGGMAGADGCAAGQRAYFLVGDLNPLHRLATELRRYFERCKAEVVWNVIAKGDHDREDRALDRTTALAILDWISSGPATPAR